MLTDNLPVRVNTNCGDTLSLRPRLTLMYVFITVMPEQHFRPVFINLPLFYDFLKFLILCHLMAASCKFAALMEEATV